MNIFDQFQPTLDETLRFINSVTILNDEVDKNRMLESGSQEEVKNYKFQHHKRLWKSLQIISEMVNGPANILEIGAMPYFFTALIRQFLPSCDITGVNISGNVWPEKTHHPLKPKEIKVQFGQIPKVETFDIYLFNVERDRFPFSSNSFDIVLCMEVIEHLVYSPTHMLAEIHRVLKDGGLLFLTTPNAVDVRKTLSILLNRSINFRYSGYSVYGRHNREFISGELRLLLESCGYKLLKIILDNVSCHQHNNNIHRLSFFLFNLISKIPIPYFRQKQEYIFTLSETVGKPIYSYPTRLYHFPNLYKSNTTSDDQNKNN
jgi:SAM-dependent methyltransferase